MAAANDAGGAAHRHLRKPDPDNPAEAGWKIAYVDESGNRYDFHRLLGLIRHNIRYDDFRREHTRRETWRAVTHESCDVEGSAASYEALSDGGAAAERIRAFDEPVPDEDPLAEVNYYNGRMSLAVEFIRSFERLKYGSLAYLRMSALLWAIYDGRKERLKGQAIFGPLGISKTNYYRRIDTYRSDLALGDWFLYAASNDLRKALRQGLWRGRGSAF